MIPTNFGVSAKWGYILVFNHWRVKLFELSFKFFFFIQWFSHFYKYRYWIWQNISLKVDALVLYKRGLFLSWRRIKNRNISQEKLGPCLKIGRVFLLSSPILFFLSPLIIHIVIVLNTLPILLQSRWLWYYLLAV